MMMMAGVKRTKIEATQDFGRTRGGQEDGARCQRLLE